MTGRTPHTHSAAHISEACYHAIRHALFPSSCREVRKDARRFKRALAETTLELAVELHRSIDKQAIAGEGR